MKLSFPTCWLMPGTWLISRFLLWALRSLGSGCIGRYCELCILATLIVLVLCGHCPRQCLAAIIPDFVILKLDISNNCLPGVWALKGLLIWDLFYAKPLKFRAPQASVKDIDRRESGIQMEVTGCCQSRIGWNTSTLGSEGQMINH